MKTSKKILVAFAGSVLLLVITGLVVLRNDLQSLHRKAESESNYKAIVVEVFQKLDFSGPWVVNIRQGKEYKVEWERDEKKTKPPLENKNGTLYFGTDAKNQDSIKEAIQVKITVPTLQNIKASRGASIHMKDFKLDSLHVQLQEGVTFTGVNNHFKKVSYATSGNVTLQLTDK